MRSIANFGVALLLVTGCSGSGPTNAPAATLAPPSSSTSLAPVVTSTPSSTMAPTPSSQSTSAPPTPRPSCPSDHGGSCLGDLAAGTYTTTVFQPTLTYTVDGDGWANYEDLPGQVLLLPPGADVAGVDPGTSDYMGVYTSVAAPLRDCSSQPDTRVPATVEGYIAWLQGNEALVVSDPVPVSMAGLDGMSIDVALSPDGGTCSDPENGLDRFEEVMIGLTPSNFSASATPDLDLRLELVEIDGKLMAVLLSDAHTGGSDFTDWWTAAQPVVESLMVEPTKSAAQTPDAVSAHITSRNAICEDASLDVADINAQYIDAPGATRAMVIEGVKKVRETAELAHEQLDALTVPPVFQAFVDAEVAARDDPVGDAAYEELVAAIERGDDIDEAAAAFVAVVNPLNADREAAEDAYGFAHCA